MNGMHTHSHGTIMKSRLCFRIKGWGKVNVKGKRGHSPDALPMAVGGDSVIFDTLFFIQSESNDLEDKLYTTSSWHFY